MISTATTDSFLEGRGIPVELASIEDELAHLWGPAAEQVGGPALENPHVTRIVLANLVVECLAGDGEFLGPVLEPVISRFPCRAIVVRGSHDNERRITAEISALCHLPAPGLPQVCSERIVLRAGAGAVDLIPGAVRPLLEVDLPMVLWWTSDPRRHETLFRDLADECSRLVLDIEDPGAEAGALRLGLDPNLCACSRDSTWFGLTRWRELVAQFFDPPCRPDRLSRITTVRIEALSPDHTQPARSAVWLAAWLAGQLGWEPQGRSWFDDGDGQGTLQARFRAPTGEVALLIVPRQSTGGARASTQVMAVTITCRGSDAGITDVETFCLRRPVPGSSAVLIEAEAVGMCRLPRVVEAPELDLSRRLAATLEASRNDPPFQKALPIALWLLEYEQSGRA
jgi:hypothetical protein